MERKLRASRRDQLRFLDLLFRSPHLAVKQNRHTCSRKAAQELAEIANRL
jgi:hypothetical protein